MREQELGKFPRLAVQKAADAIDYMTPIRMDVDRIRLGIKKLVYRIETW